MAEKTFTKDELDKAVADATTKIQESIDKLEAKNAELLDEAKKAKAELRKSKEIDPAEVERLHAEVEELQGKLGEAQKQAKDATSAKEKAEKALVAEQGFTQRLLIQDGLKSALIEQNVKDPDFIDTLTAKFAAGATIKTEGDTRSAMFGDKLLGDYIKEWAASDAGKKFVAAPANSGGGANGGAQNGNGVKQITRTEFDAMPASAKVKFGQEGGRVVDA